MKLSGILEPMVAAGVDAQTILATVKAWEAQQTDALERRRASDRERQERRRHVTSRDVTVTVSSHAGVTRVEDKPLPTEIEPQKKEQKETRSTRDVCDFRSELSPHLDAERLDALVKHRRSKRGQITGLAARLFRRDAELCSLSLADATDTCISRNWITVKPEWLGDRRQQAPPRTAINPTLAAALKLQEKFDAVTPSETEGNHPAPRLVAIGGRTG